MNVGGTLKEIHDFYVLTDFEPRYIFSQEVHHASLDGTCDIFCTI
jgi:hypothetical protein